MNATTLRLLIDRAKAASDLAQARHGGLRRAEDQARVHLTMLHRYAGEYAERARAQAGDSRDPSADRNQVVFLARLQVAIDTQAAEVAARVKAAAVAAQDVAACLQRQKSLETLDARRRQDEERIAARREQKNTDEFAQRASDRFGGSARGYDDGHAGRQG